MDKFVFIPRASYCDAPQWRAVVSIELNGETVVERVGPSFAVRDDAEDHAVKAAVDACNECRRAYWAPWRRFAYTCPPVLAPMPAWLLAADPVPQSNGDRSQ